MITVLQDITYFNNSDWYWMGGSPSFTVCKLKNVDRQWWTYHEWESGWNPYKPHVGIKLHKGVFCKATSVPLVKVKDLKGTKVCLKDHPEYTGELTGVGNFDSVGVTWNKSSPGSVYYWNHPLKLKLL